MLTNKGISQARNDSPHPRLYALGAKNDSSLSFIPPVCSERTSGYCCEGVNYIFQCSLCNIIVNLESKSHMSKEHENLIRNAVHAAHNHDDVYSKLLHVNDYYIDSKGVGGNADTAYGKDVKCGMCDETFKLSYQFNRRPISKQKVNIFEILNYLNIHYSKCKSAVANIDNRKYDLELMHLAIQKCIEDNKIDLTLSKEKSDTIKIKHMMIKKIRKCNCGMSDIVSCIVCGSEWKSRKISFDEYLKSISHHFGKKTAKYDHTDFVISSKELNTMICVICGDDYGISAPKEIVLDHFRLCVEKNRDYFSTRGYKCSH